MPSLSKSNITSLAFDFVFEGPSKPAQREKIIHLGRRLRPVIYSSFALASKKSYKGNAFFRHTQIKNVLFAVGCDKNSK